MGRFSKYLGKIELTVDSQELELEVIMKDIKKLLTMTGGQTKGIDDVGVEKLTGTFIDIMNRSYPEAKDNDNNHAENEAFVTRTFMEFMNELFIAMGWMTREDVENQRKNLTGALSPQSNEK